MVAHCEKSYCLCTVLDQKLLMFSWLISLTNRNLSLIDTLVHYLHNQLGINDLTDYNSLAMLLAELPQPFTFADAQEFHGLIDEFGKQYFHPVEDFQKSFLAGDQLILK